MSLLIQLKIFTSPRTRSAPNLLSHQKFLGHENIVYRSLQELLHGRKIPANHSYLKISRNAYGPEMWSGFGVRVSVEEEDRRAGCLTSACGFCLNSEGVYGLALHLHCSSPPLPSPRLSSPISPASLLISPVPPFPPLSCPVGH